MVALVLWALVWPANANATLGSWNWSLLERFNGFYIVITGFFAFFLLVIALLPNTGKRIMGTAGETPEFSNFSWFSMMFGAGLGVGLMVFATAEPIGLWAQTLRSFRARLKQAAWRRSSQATAIPSYITAFTLGQSMS